MRKTNKKIFGYEFKKTVLIPALLLGAYTVIYLIDLLFNVFGENVIDAERISKWCLYGFYAVLIGLFTYRTFTTRKIYEKMRIDKQKLFLVRALYVFLYAFISTTLFVALGTLRMAVFKWTNYQEYLRFDYDCMFAYQGKTWLYSLFGVSVGVTAVLTYCVAAFIERIIYSKERWYFKLVYGALFALAVLMMHYPVSFFYRAPSLGHNELFAPVIPYGAMTYEHFNEYVVMHVNHVSYGVARVQLLRCDLCWNITNVWGVLSAVFTFAFTFFAMQMLQRRVNDGYFVRKKEEKNDD